ncbi:MAG: zinc-ribbon domain containing protein [Candidatus Hadarchaeum sp.]|uniref:zinc-ribbon domain containing protein n=1 Tax=Candidatus Hadarchaeum sp. TaxID=2883567 RepID=UPI003D0A2E52
MKKDPKFKYDEKVFLKSPIDLLWTRLDISCLLARKAELGIVELQRYPVLKDIEIECIVCGKTFVFSGGEQKWYRKLGFSPPKRCPECRERECMEGLREW